MMNTLLALFALALAVPVTGFAYEKAFEGTDPGIFEIKTIPPHTLAVAERKQSYFDGNNVLFGKLFRYISANNISMTVPVKADINPGRMYFYIGSTDVEKAVDNSDDVTVVTEPERTVLSHGVRGGYSENNYREALIKLYDELEKKTEWEAAGEAYAIFWNGPYVPSFMKKFEIHIPVKPAKQVDKTS